MLLCVTGVLQDGYQLRFSIFHFLGISQSLPPSMIVLWTLLLKSL